MARRRLARIIIPLFLGVAGCAFGLYRLMNARTFQVFGTLVASVPRTDRVIALTIDDGPTPEGTEALLAFLSERHVRATFFVNGESMRRYPEAGRRIVQAGHQLGNHGDTHTRLILHSQAFVKREIEATDQAIRAAGYQGRIVFRPPYGKKLFGLPWFLRQTGRITVMWNLEPDSARGVPPTPEGQAAYVAARATPGSILLTHAMFDATGEKRRALGLMIRALTAAGYRFVTIDELLRD